MEPSHRHVDILSQSAPFWEGTKAKQFMVQFCRATGKPQFYPRANNRYSGRRDVGWREVSGRGVVFSYTVARKGSAGFQGDDLYIVVVVTLAEGVNVLSNMTACAPNEIHIGMPVELSWLPLPNGLHLPLFQPAVTA